MIKIKVPNDVNYILKTFYKYNYEAYIVGGCVRDSIMNRIPKDWDITTNATPEQMIEICKKENINFAPTGLKYGTISLIINNVMYETTTFINDGKYNDNRHPNNVIFTNNLKLDISRRDFTMNAIAYSDRTGIIDPFNGLGDIRYKRIKCVGNPMERFDEDKLRILRAIRFACQLGFSIEQKTNTAIYNFVDGLDNISKERIRDEFSKILLSPNASLGVRYLLHFGIMDLILPGLSKCEGFDQKNPHHDKTVLEHILCVMDNVQPKLELRLSALMHDIGKPECFEVYEDGTGHFHNHHLISARIARENCENLKFPNATTDKIYILVREHMSRFEKLREKNIKKFINRIGIENLDDLFELQIADIKGCAPAYQDFSNINKLKDECVEIINRKEPLSRKDLVINGRDLINMGITSGKQIGKILNELLEIVLKNPELNTKDILIGKAKEMM